MTDRYPEVEIARLVQKRHDFGPGSDLLELVKRYAEVDYLPIPVDKVDGVSLNLKANDRRPSIIVNSHIPETRAKFTLAHEFGHVLIPWHIGTIFSYTDSEKHTEDADQAYWEMEAEANRFAAELLMPQHWLKELYEAKQNPAFSASEARRLCGTSMQAVIIAVNKSLPPGYVYAAVEDGRVTASAASRGTYVAPLAKGAVLDASPQLAESKKCFAYDFKGIEHNWLAFEAEQEIDADTDPRPWREVLDEVMRDTKAEDIQANIRSSLNAIVASTNNKEYSAKAFFAAVRQKLAAKGAPYDAILNHHAFASYVSKRIEDLMGRRR